VASSRQLRPNNFTADNFAALAIDWVPLDHAASEPVMIGDLVSASIDDLPVYRVMALDEDRAWVATHPGAPQRMMSLAAMRWRGVERLGCASNSRPASHS
jgi:hypothetical protein